MLPDRKVDRKRVKIKAQALYIARKEERKIPESEDTKQRSREAHKQDVGIKQAQPAEQPTHNAQQTCKETGRRSKAWYP